MTTTTIKKKLLGLSAERVFMLSALVVNGGNYLYNLALGRLLGPEAFADAAILVTFLMVLSFVAMTFQLTVTKFIAGIDNEYQQVFFNTIKRISFWVGLLIGVLIAFNANTLQSVFNTQTPVMFYFFAAGIPVYFLMSTNRGYFQGTKSFYKLSATYQTEMMTRLLLTIVLIVTVGINSSILISIGILVSFIVGLFPFHRTQKSAKPSKSLSLAPELKKQILLFIGITAFYECTQIIINNSDILLVKHFFEAQDAGLYASLALIGRMVYFVTWMFVMILLPTVVSMKKNGEDTLPVFFKYLGMITLLAGSILVATVAFPETIIHLMFGKAYLSMAPLLWKYAMATTLFAIGNVFVYYFLSLEKYIPVVVSGIFGLSQVAGIFVWHESLAMVIEIQIYIMSGLLFFQAMYFIYQHSKTIRLQ